MIGKGIERLKTVTAIGLSISLAACQGAGQQPAMDVSVQEDGTNTAMTLDQQIVFARQELADRLGVSLDSITISGARNVNWSSGALGCPKPGMSYTEALVPGVLIFLDSGGKTYGYHARKENKPFYCPTKQAAIPTTIQKEDLA